jgi:hypothetical protein
VGQRQGQTVGMLLGTVEGCYVMCGDRCDSCKRRGKNQKQHQQRFGSYGSISRDRIVLCNVVEHASRRQ